MIEGSQFDVRKVGCVGGRVPHVTSGRKFLSDKGEQCDVRRVGCMKGWVSNLT